MINVLLVDDHEVVRTGVRRILEEAGIDVVGEAHDGGSALEMAGLLAPDVVLMDIGMPGMGGIEATRRIVQLRSRIKVIVFTVWDDHPFPAHLKEAGAAGFLTKGCPAHELIEAIRTVTRGFPYTSKVVAQNHLKSHWKKGPAQTPFELLSGREFQVAVMIVNGKRNQPIAEALFVSEKTISTYRNRIYAKLGIKTEAELTRLAYRYGVITDFP